MKLDKVEKLYTKNLEVFGIDSRSVGWNSPESQVLRFEKLINNLILDKSEPFSINELGCGYGELYKFLKKSNFCLEQFIGYDISQPMLDSCKKYLDEPDNLILFNASQINTISDYSITSGIFNTPFDNKEEDWKEYIFKTINNLHENSLKGIAFNFLTSHVDFKAENLYYQNPNEIFSYCIKKFGKNVQLIHDYPLFEFTVIVRKHL